MQSVSKAYDGTPVLRDVSLRVEAGERLVVSGPSGCGKTTLLRLVAGFVAPDAGCIVIGDETAAREGRNLLAPEDRRLGMVFQDLALWPHLTVRGNLAFGLKAQGVRSPEREERIRSILEMMQMSAFADVKPAQLSGGQQQRVALARALVLRPDILLMDEPLSSMDEALNIRLGNEILRLHRQLGFTLLYVTHSRAEAANIATRLIQMRNGTIASGE